MAAQHPVVVLDIETTSLDVADGAIIEIAACRYPVRERQLSKRPSDTFHTLVKPRVPIEQDAFAIHGISDAQATAEGQEPRRAFDALQQFIQADDLVAHNGVFFDYLYVANELSRHGVEVPDNRLLDTLPLARAHLKSRSYSLGALCDAYGIVNLHAHRALTDVDATAQLFGLIIEREADFDTLWAESAHYTLRSLLEVPEGFELLQRALDERRKLCIEYAGANKPARTRWIEPRRIDITRAGHRSVRALCLESDAEKQFRLDRIVRLISVE